MTTLLKTCGESPASLFFDGLASYNITFNGAASSWEGSPSATVAVWALIQAWLAAFPDTPLLAIPPLLNVLIGLFAWYGYYKLGGSICVLMLPLPYLITFNSVYFSAGFALCLFIGAWKFTDLAAGTAPAHVVASPVALLVHMSIPVESDGSGCDRTKLVPRTLRSLMLVCAGAVALEAAPALAPSLDRAAHAASLPTLPPPVYDLLALWADCWRVLCLLQLPICSCQLALASLGYTPQVVFRDPLLLSTAPSDFWGRRWNLLIHGLFKRTIFKPLRSRGVPSQLAALSAFLVSGLFHEYAFLAPAAARRLSRLSRLGDAVIDAGPSMPTASLEALPARHLGAMLVFFGAQAVVVTLEKLAGVHTPTRLLEALGRAPVLCTLLTYVCILPLAPYFMAPLRASGLFREMRTLVEVLVLAPASYLTSECVWGSNAMIARPPFA